MTERSCGCFLASTTDSQWLCDAAIDGLGGAPTEAARVGKRLALQRQGVDEVHVHVTVTSIIVQM